MSERSGLQKALDTFKGHTIVACEANARVPARLALCSGYVGRLDTFLPNLSSMHNAIRCPECGSTQNVYNRIHSRMVSARD